MKKSVLRELQNFVFNPTASIDTDNIYSKIWKFTQLLSFSFVIASLLGVLGNILSKSVGFDVEKNNLVNQFIDTSSVWSAVFRIVFFGPLFEEICFRLVLSKQKFIFLIGLVFTFFVLSQTPFVIGIFSLFLSLVSLPISTELLAFFTFIFLPAVLSIVVSANKMEQFLTHNFRWIVYASIIAFELVHIANYIGLENKIWLGIFLTLPQLFVGMVLAFTRVKLGFLWSILLHSSYNGVLFALLVLSTMMANNQYTELASLGTLLLITSTFGILVYSIREYFTFNS